MAASPVSDTEGVTPSQTGCTWRKPDLMSPPEEKLTHFDSQAQAMADSQQFDACIQDLVRCVALTRLVFGEGHVKLAQAYARLAKAYLQFKGYGAQAQQHASTARGLLPFCSPLSSSREDRLQVLTCLLSIHLTQGGAALLTANPKEAESSYLKAEKALDELHQQGAVSREDKAETDTDIATSLCRVYQRLGRPREALRQAERALGLLEGRDDKIQEICNVYKEMAMIEQNQGQLDKAIEHLSKAHATAVSQGLGGPLPTPSVRPREGPLNTPSVRFREGPLSMPSVRPSRAHSPCPPSGPAGPTPHALRPVPGGPDGAGIAHRLALLLSTEPRHNDSAARHFEESLSAYRSCLGPQDPAFLTAQDDYCRFLLLHGQQEKCVEMQRASLSLKRSTFGDLSVELADTLQLIGGVEMTQGRVSQAHRTLSKCLEIQSLLYGPQHKKTRSTQRTVDRLAQAPEVAGRRGRGAGGETRPPFCAAPPSHGRGG